MKIKGKSLRPERHIGDNNAKRMLYQKYSHSVYNSCYRLLRQAEEAEDAMQDCFIKAFEHINKLKQDTPLEPWLKRIAINTSIDKLRKKHFDLFGELLDEYAEDEQEEKDINDIQLKVESIKRGINALPNAFRIVVNLHLIEGYDFEEIEQILGITASTARSHYSRGRQRLLKEIQ